MATAGVPVTEGTAGEDTTKEAGLWGPETPLPTKSGKVGASVVGSGALYVDAFESSIEYSAAV